MKNKDFKDLLKSINQARAIHRDMLQESPKFPGLGKKQKQHPKLRSIKTGTSKTRRMPSKEWIQPLSKYPKTIKYYNEYKPR